MRRVAMIVAVLMSAAALSLPAHAAPEYVISGLVLGDGQRPLSGITVTVRDAAYRPTSVRTTRTGRYRVAVPIGTYSVSFSDEGGVYAPEDFDADGDGERRAGFRNEVVVADRDVVGVDAQLVRYATVSGRILAGGVPVKESVSVRLVPRVAGDDIGKFVDDDGRFRLTNVIPGEYSVIFRDGPEGFSMFARASVRVPSGGRVTLPVQNFVRLADLGRIRGTVTMPHRAGPSTLKRLPTAGGSMGSESVSPPQQVVDFQEVRPGNHRLVFEEHAWVGGHSYYSAARFAVAKGRTTKIAVAGGVRTEVHARVRNIRGLGIPGLSVLLYRAGDTTEEVATGSTQEGGILRFSGVPEGQYRLKLVDPTGNYRTTTVDYVPADRFVEETIITMAHRRSLAPVTDDQSATLRVRSHGVRSADDWVLYRTDDSVVPASVTKGRGDDEGLVPRQVAPGTYKLLLGAHTWYGGRTFDTATTLTLSPGESKTLDVEGLPPNGQLIGEAFGDDDFLPVDSIVTVYAADNSRDVITRARLWAQYRLDRLPIRPYKLQISDPTGRYVTRWVGGGTSFASAAAITPDISNGTRVQPVTLRRNFIAVSAPAIKGTTILGRTLTATRPLFSMSVNSLSRRWFRDGRPIKGATGSRYRLTRADVGSRITVRMVGRRAQHQAVGATSVPTAVVTR